MSSRLLVLNDLDGSSGALAREFARIHHVVLMRAMQEPIAEQPWQTALVRGLSGAEHAFARELWSLSSMSSVGRALAAGDDVAWATGASGPRIASLAMSAGVLADRLSADDRLVMTPWLDEVAPLTRALHESAVWVALLRAEAGARRRLHEWIDLVGLLGARPAAVVIADVPTKETAWPQAWARDQRRRARRLAELAQGAGAATSIVSRAVRGVALEAVDRRSLRRLAVSASHSPEGQTVEEREDGLSWRVPIVVPRGERALRVGRIDDALFIELRQAPRLVALPSVIARCTIVGASVRRGELRVHAVPDPTRWRAA